ncbi:MAG: phosphoribosylformylglycinamidine synthase subunit PurS [Minisyncoccales bacterium]
MIHRIEVYFKKEIRDAKGESIKKRIKEDLGILVNEVKTVDVYTIDADLSKKQLDLLGGNLFANPVIQEFSIDSSPTTFCRKVVGVFDWLIEIGFKPGVTDNVAKTAKGAIEDMLGKKINGDIYTSKKYLIAGQLEKKDIEKIAQDILANELIQRWLILNKKSLKRKNIYLPIPKVNIPPAFGPLRPRSEASEARPEGRHKPAIREIDLNVSDEELLRISEERKLALNLKEMLKIRNYFLNPKTIRERQRFGLDEKPTDAELEVLAQTWSEHCKHKIFNAKINYRNEEGKQIKINSLFNTYIKSSTKQLQKKLNWVVSTLWDNSGVIKFNKDWLLAIKCETHNSPSNKEPYGGAITGIVGVYRDPMGTGRGCKLIYGTYGFCTGSPFYNGELKPKLSPKRLLEGVRKGVEDGGNKSGVPTVYGITFFDDGYMGKPAIYVLAAGLIPAKVCQEPGYKKEVNTGDLIVMCGGRVGIDGIHGATESSMEAGERISASHVQIGDPFTQKKMHDFLLEARDSGLYKGITDNGAGGLSSSVGEMAELSNGFELELAQVPLKYTGLDPWQILVSESQERMTLAVSLKNINRILELAKKHEVETTVIGKFTNSGKFFSTYQNKTVTYMDMDFTHKGVPKMELEAEWQTPESRGLSEPKIEEIKNHSSILKKILARINICSKEYITRQFDHEVQGTSVIKHLVGKDSDVNSDAVVIKPVLNSQKAIAITAGINPKYSQIDTYHMTACAIDEAIRRIIAVGGSLKKIALNDNFCWPSPLLSEQNPDAKYKLAQLIRANQALYDYTLAFKTPCISGKDSMSMDGAVEDKNGRKLRISTLPTVQFSAAGEINDIRKCITMEVKKPRYLVYVLGITSDELGGSEYYEMRGEIGLNAPKVNSKKAIKLYNALSEAIDKGLVSSAHGCYKGGLGVALAQISFAGGYGLEINLDKVPIENLRDNDKILYSESASRFVVTVSPKNKERFEKMIKGNIFSKIGYVGNNEILRIKGVNKKIIIQENIYKLKEAWQSTFKNF